MMDDEKGHDYAVPCMGDKGLQKSPQDAHGKGRWLQPHGVQHVSRAPLLRVHNLSVTCQGSAVYSQFCPSYDEQDHWPTP